MKRQVRRVLGTPLARWGFTVLAVVAAIQAMAIPALACGAVAYQAWEARS